MSVFTRLSDGEISRFAASAALGAVVETSPVADGIENTIYKVETERGPFILTLFENADTESVRAIGELLSILHERGVKVAAPVGELSFFDEKPLLFFPYVKGTQPGKLSESNLRSLGREVANLHLSGYGLSGKIAPEKLSRLHLSSRVLAEAEKEANFFPEYTDFLLTEALYQSRVPEEGLPGGLIHADLFPDNLIFDPENGGVLAILDFALAGYGPYVFDVGVALLACVYLTTSDWTEREKLAGFFLEGYECARVLEPEERALIVPYIRRAALRYLCLRLERRRNPSKSGVVKDPDDLVKVIESFKY